VLAAGQVGDFQMAQRLHAVHARLVGHKQHCQTLVSDRQGDRCCGPFGGQLSPCQP
jgi:hypothetical protein